MAFDLKLPKNLADQQWKVKIANLERVEPPHVTIIRKTTRWRFGLREKGFLDKKPDPSEVVEDLIQYILQSDPGNSDREIYGLLCREWDKMYPLNPVAGAEDD